MLKEIFKTTEDLQSKIKYEFLGSIPSIKSVVVGMSKKEHINETVDAINKHIKG